MSSDKSGYSSKAARKIGDGFCIAALLSLFLLFFHKTIFFKNSISRISVLPEWDSVFDAWRTGNVQSYDPSLIQIFIPDYVFIANNFARGILPLWNSYSGLGYPFLADIQSSVFAPMRIIFDLAPGLYSYNLYLLIELLVCALGTFYLARALGQSGLPALFAAATYTFCPYNLWYLELNLGSAHCLFPLTTLCFVNVARKKTAWSAILAGLSCTLLIISGHPECAFFGIVFASILFFLLLLQDDPRLGPARRLGAFLSLLFLAGICALCTSAPVLFPFVEYLANAESYKYGSAYSTPVTWNGILMNLANPIAGGASPYLGVVTVLLLPLSIILLILYRKYDKNHFSILLLAAICFLIVTQIGPIYDLFSRPPLTALITRYALPYLLMLLCLIGSRGVQFLMSFFTFGNFIQDRGKSFDNNSPLGAWLAMKKLAYAGRREQKLIFIALIFLSLCLSAIGIFTLSKIVANNTAFLAACDFDAMLPKSQFSKASWNRDLIASIILIVWTAICSLALWSSGKLRSSPIRLNQHLSSPVTLCLAFAPALLLIQLISIGNVAKLSLPAQTKFFYPEIELSKIICDPSYRTISLCEHVLRPATNAVYGINFLQVHNPLFPRRYLQVIKSAGAETGTFNQTFQNVSSPLLSLCSVKYFLALNEKEVAACSSLKEVFQTKNHIRVFENSQAVPRAFLAARAVKARNADEALAFISSKNFNAFDLAILESDTISEKDLLAQNDQASSKIGTAAPLSAEAKVTGVSDFNDSGSNKVTLSCNAEKDSWLILTDIFYPGWNAYVDGKKTEIVRADYAFRGIRMKAGKHDVSFVYEPNSFKLGMLTCGGFMLIAILALGLRRVLKKN